MKVLDIRARSSKLEQILGFVNLTGKADFSVGFPSLSELALSETKGDKLTKSCYTPELIAKRLLLKTNAPEPVGPVAFLSGAPGRIRTCDLRIRSPFEGICGD